MAFKKYQKVEKVEPLKVEEIEFDSKTAAVKPTLAQVNTAK